MAEGKQISIFEIIIALFEIFIMIFIFDALVFNMNYHYFIDDPFNLDNDTISYSITNIEYISNDNEAYDKTGYKWDLNTKNYINLDIHKGTNITIATKNISGAFIFKNVPCNKIYAVEGEPVFNKSNINWGVTY